MKRFLYIVTAAVLCLALIGCENTDNDLSSIGSLPSPLDYSSYSTANSDTESLICDIQSSEIPIADSSSGEEASSPSSSETPQSSSSTPAIVPTPTPTPKPSSSESVAPECKHSFALTANTATCTAGGQSTYTCSICGKSYKEQSVAQGHKLSGHKCSVCGMVDEDKMKENLYNWAVANSIEESFSKYYYLPSDNRYKFSAIGKGNYIFYYDDEANGEHISVSVYGFEKNKCYINYILNDLQIEGDFPMDAVHSTDRNFFNVMNAASNAAAAKKDELTASLRSKIDGFLKKFETEMLIPKTNITLNDLGFKCY